MQTKILTLIAFLLAIPTFGISLAVWFFIKFKYDKTMARALMPAILVSYKNGGKEEVRFAINNASLSLVFDMYGGKQVDQTGLNNAVVGVLPHPHEDIMLKVLMAQSSGNRVLIRATDLPR